METLRGEENTGNAMPEPFLALDTMHDDDILGGVDGVADASFAVSTRVAQYNAKDTARHGDNMWRGASITVAHIMYDHTVFVRDLYDPDTRRARTFHVASYQLVDTRYGQHQRKNDDGHPLLSLRLPDVLAGALHSNSGGCNGKEILYPVVFTVNHEDVRSRGGPDGCLHDGACMLAIFDTIQLRWLVRVDMPNGRPSTHSNSVLRPSNETSTDVPTDDTAKRPDAGISGRMPTPVDVQAEGRAWQLLVNTSVAMACALRWTSNQRSSYGEGRARMMSRRLRYQAKRHLTSELIRSEVQAARLGMLCVGIVDALRHSASALADDIIKRHHMSRDNEEALPESLWTLDGDPDTMASFRAATIANALDTNSPDLVYPEDEEDASDGLWDVADVRDIDDELDKWLGFLQPTVITLRREHSGHILNGAVNIIAAPLADKIWRHVDKQYTLEDSRGINLKMAAFHNAILSFACVAFESFSMVRATQVGDAPVERPSAVLDALFTKRPDGTLDTIRSALAGYMKICWAGDDYRASSQTRTCPPKGTAYTMTQAAGKR